MVLHLTLANCSALGDYCGLKLRLPQNSGLSRLVKQRRRKSVNMKEPMRELTMPDDDLSAEIDFSKGTWGIHHSPSSAKVFVPASIERGVWDITDASGKRLHGF